jgi:hypothetical protein
MSRCRPQVGQHRPPPLRPPFPGSSTSTWGESGWGGGWESGVGGRNGGAASPNRPPSVQVLHLHGLATQQIISPLSGPSPPYPRF